MASIAATLGLAGANAADIATSVTDDQRRSLTEVTVPPVTLACSKPAWQTDVREETRVASVAGNHIAFTGRIDNGDAIRGALPGQPGAPSGAAELVARSYTHWGPACLERLVGAYAVVLWDPEADRLLAARDPTGLRPLYVATTAGGVVVASRSTAVAAHPAVPDSINEGMLVEYLTGRVKSRTESFRDGVQRLAPGECLLVDGDERKRVQYWSYGDPTVADAGPDALAERLRDRIRTAIRCRFDPDGTTGVLMSGGLDSTGVAALAAADEAVPSPIRARSVVFDDIPDIDERSGVRAVANAHGLDVEVIDGAGLGPFDGGVSAIEACRDNPCADTSLPIYAAAFRAVQADTERVLLSGLGGNLLDGHRSVHLDAVSNGAVATLGRALLAGTVGPGELLTYVFQLMGSPERTVKEFERLQSPPDRDLVTEQARTRVDLANRLGTMPELPAQDRYERLTLYRALRDPYMDFARESLQRLSGAFDLTHRHPLLDVRVVDLLFSLPARCLYRNGTRKWLYRRAMRESLPASVLTQPVSANDYNSYLVRSATRNAEHLAAFEPTRLRERQLVSPGVVEELTAHEEWSGQSTQRLWRLYSAERWLRAVADG